MRFIGTVQPKLSFCLVLVVAGMSAAVAADLEIIDTRVRDQLEDVNHAPAGSDVPVGPGEAVSSFNGNLQLIHASSPVLPLDGGFSLGLTRAYNSNNVKTYLVQTNGLFGYAMSYAGQSWVGLGWTSHLGRVFQRSRYSVVPGGTWTYAGVETFFEFPDGGLYRFEPTVQSAHPRLKIQQFVACDGSAPPPPPWPPDFCSRYPDAPRCENPPPDPCAGRPPNDPAHYIVTFPGGTKYRLEQIVPYQYSTESNGWITNHDRAGFYTTRITDPQDNDVLNIEYWGAGYPYPEAIKRIWSVLYPEMEITTTLCTLNDPDPGQCPVYWSDGLLKEVRATGFKGQRSQPQTAIQRFFYSVAPVQVEYSLFQEPVLSEVRTEGSDGATGGSIRYEYGVGRSVGQTVTTYGPLLDRITYPLGAVNEYRYDQFRSGSRLYSGSTVQRQIVGVGRQTTYPEGLNPDGSITGKPHFSWSWSRDFGSTNCSGGAATRTNAYTQVAPDGRETDFTVGGNPCGQTTPLEGPFGNRTSTTILEGNPGVPLRTLNTIFDIDTDVDSEIFGALWQATETVYNDDTDVCFVSAGSQAKLTETTNLVRNPEDFWTVVVQGGDAYMPVLNGEPVRRVTVTDYATPTGCTTHVPGAFDYRYVEEGVGSERRFEENFVFNCNGQLVETRVKDEWQTATTDPDTGTPVVLNQADDGDDLKTTLQYDSRGNAIGRTLSGGDAYPSGGASNSYASTSTWERGTQINEQVPGLSYLTLDVTADPGGQVAASRDPNGLETRYDYDGLGRPLEIDPTGSEHKTRYIYPDLKHVRIITSPGTETVFDSANDEQLFEERELDGLGRSIQTWRAMPDGSRSTRVTRYDQLGRAIFVSEWLTESQYASATMATWESGDVDGDGIDDYRVAGVPVQDGTGRPWGTTIFYGTPDPTDPDDPLRATPDGLGRVRRTQLADGSVTHKRYCGPHEEITVEGVATTSGSAAAITRNYFDAFGRLVLVDAPPGSADAEYSYDPRGNLTRVNLADQLPSNPFEAWRQGTIPLGQVRTWAFDAAGRLWYTVDPEAGQTINNAYDSGGNVLTWQDQLGVNRGYFFRNTFDPQGRLTRVDKIRGSPWTPYLDDMNRMGSSGDFEESSDLQAADLYPNRWTEGAIVAGQFQVGPSDWQQLALGSCIAAPPGSGNTGGLYLGDSATCSYGMVAAGAQAVRYRLNSISREDYLSFKFWREVREGAAGKDILSAFVIMQSEGNSVTNARYVFQLDSQQASYAQWRQTQFVRLGDVFSEAEWPQPTLGDPQVRNLFLYIVFDKGDAELGVLGAGVAIDDVFVGQLGVEKVAEYAHDVDLCAMGSAGEACTVYTDPTNRFKGRLGKIVSYQSGRPVVEESLVYRGLNGRLSGRQVKVDWAGVGEFATFAQHYNHTPQGALASYDAPYTPGVQATRQYQLSYKRGYLDGVWNGIRQFLSPDATPPAIEYTPGGSVAWLRFANGTRQSIAHDAMDRTSMISLAGPTSGGGGTISLWSTGSYMFDGAGNIKSIGEQDFAYDLAGRLVRAEVLEQEAVPQLFPTPYIVDYNYDPLGNMTSRQWAPPAGSSEAPPAGMNFNRSYGSTASSKNRVTDPGFSYDPTGNATRAIGAIGSAVTWDSLGRVASFYNGQPELGSHRVAERYLYDASGARIVRYPDGSLGDGRPVISLRDVGGTLLSEFIVDPATGNPRLEKDFVYGAGRLLVERKVMEEAPVLRAAAALSGTGPIHKYYKFDVVDGAGATSFTVDIRTASGYVNHLSGLTLNALGQIPLLADELSEGEVNFVRIRGDEPSLTAYSVPVTLKLDAAVEGSFPNQVNAVSVSRVGSDVFVSFSLYQANGKKTDVYFERGDTGQKNRLTTPGLDAGVTNYTATAQSLATSCGSMLTKQQNMYSTASLLPRYDITQNVGTDPAECGGGGGGGGAPGPVFADFYHHRDHLGSLRLVTDDAGFVLSRHDFYPFGIEMFDPVEGVPGESRMRYTVHERDAATGADYMMARYKLSASPSFLRPDFIDDVSMAGPSSWNKYSYVRSNPLSFVDPTGNRIRLNPDYRPSAGPWPVPGLWTYASEDYFPGFPTWGAYTPTGGPIGGNGGYGTTGIMDLNRASWFYELISRQPAFAVPWFLGMLGGSPYESTGLPWGGYASAGNIPTYNPFRHDSGANLQSCTFGYEVNEFRRGYDQWAAQRAAEWYPSSFGRGCYNTTIELAPFMPRSTHHCRRVIYETGWGAVVPDRNAPGVSPAHYKWLIECQAANGSGFEPIEFLDPWGLFFPW